MGRSVSVPSDAVAVFYVDWMLDEEDLAEAVAESMDMNEVGDLCRHDLESYRDSIQSDQFDYLIYDLVEHVLKPQFPSVTEVDDWLGNEDHVIAENGLARFGISEYCGLAAVWVITNQRESWGWDAPDPTPLALHWISQAWPKVEAMFPHRLGLMGRFSNGEAVYQREEKA